MGVPPKVTAATGMYMVMFSTIVSVTLYVLYGTLNYQYGLWIGFWSVIGTVGGSFAIEKVNKKFNR